MLPIHENPYKMLCEIDAICRDNGITYYLSGGSVLGAVRHRGFIPWDDDLDVCMTRDNWEKFIAAAKRGLPEDRMLECTEMMPDCPSTIARYINTASTTIYRNQILGDASGGQAVDVLILDPAPSDPEGQQKYIDDFMLYGRLTVPYYYYAQKKTSYEPLKKALKRAKKIGLEKVKEELRQRLFTMPDDDKCEFYCYRWPGEQRFFYDKSLFGTPRYIQFEEGLFPVPEKTEEYLTAVYGGDWFMQPPKSSREQHEVVRDLDVPYQKYFDDYLPYIDTNAALDDYWNRKIYRLQEYDLRKQVFPEIHAMPGEAAALALPKRMERLGYTFDDLRVMLHEGEFEPIYEVFADYYAAQFNASAKYWSLFVDIGDEALHAALMAYALDGKLRLAARIMPLREAARPLDGYMTELKQLIEDMEAATAARYSGRNEEAMEKTASILARYPHCYEMQRIAAALAAENDDPDAAIEKIDVMLEQHPNDGEMLKARGDAFLRIGETRDAAINYIFSGIHTNNGMVLLDRNDKLKLVLEKAYEEIDAMSASGEKEAALEYVRSWLRLKMYRRDIGLRVREAWLSLENCQNDEELYAAGEHIALVTYYYGEDIVPCFEAALDKAGATPEEKELCVMAALSKDSEAKEHAIETLTEKIEAEDNGCCRLLRAILYRQQKNLKEFQKDITSAGIMGVPPYLKPRLAKHLKALFIARAKRAPKQPEKYGELVEACINTGLLAEPGGEAEPGEAFGYGIWATSLLKMAKGCDRAARLQQARLETLQAEAAEDEEAEEETENETAAETESTDIIDETEYAEENAEDEEPERDMLADAIRLYETALANTESLWLKESIRESLQKISEREDAE